MRRTTALAVHTTPATNSDIHLVLSDSPRSSVYTDNSIDLKHPISSPDSSTHSINVPTPEPQGPQPSIRLLFSLISRRQFFILVIPAILSSVISGGIAPFMTYVIGQSFDAFAQFPLTPNPPQAAKDQLLRDVGRAALELVGLAAGALALSSITSSLWIWTGEHNVMALRKRVYEAVTQKEMLWFDTKMGADGTVQSAEDEQGPLGAGGLMAKFTRCVSSPTPRPQPLTYPPPEKPTTSAWPRPSRPACSSST